MSVFCATIACIFAIFFVEYTTWAVETCSLQVFSLSASTVDEGTEGRIEFDLISNCPSTTVGVIKLSKKLPNRLIDMCSIFFPLESGGDDSCGCSRRKRPSQLTCQFKKKMKRSDSTQWRLWSGGSMKIEDRDFTVNVTYPPEITRLTLGEDSSGSSVVTVDKGAGDVEARCLWTNGNPPRTVRLLGPNDATLNSTDRSGSGQLQASLQGPACRHSGEYRCQVEGTGQRQTAQLLVKCRLRIEGVPSQRPRELYPGNDVQVDVKVVSYTTDITHCRMSGPTYFSANSGQPTERCESLLSVSGIPPDLQVTLTLVNVSDQHSGRWRLWLSNDIGENDVFFALHVISGFVSSETSSAVATRSTITTTLDGRVPVEAEVPPLNTEDPKPSVSGLTMVPFGVSIIAATGIVLIIVTIVSLYVCVVLKRIGNHVTLPTRQQDAVVEVPGRECQGQGDSSQQEHVYEEVAEPLPRPPFCFRSTQVRISVSSRPPATLPRPCAPSLSHTGLRPIATPTQAKNNQSAELSCPDTFLQPTTTPTQYENNQSAEPSCPGTYLHTNAAPKEYENNQSAELSFPDTYLHPLATPTQYENNQSAEPSCPDMYLHPIATPTEYENNQSAEPSYPDTYLHPIATPTEYENNQSAEPSYPDTYLHPIATPTEYENNQSAEPSYPDTYLHPIATPTEYENNQSAESSYPDTYLHPIATPTEYENNQSAESSYPDTYLHPIATPTEYENNQSADCLELDEGGYLKPMDLLQKQLICQTKV